MVLFGIMSGTALYRALVHAGAPEEEAKEAAGELDSFRETTNEKLTDIQVSLSRLDTAVKILIALVLAVLIKSFF